MAYLDERSSKLLMEMIKNPNLSREYLCDKCSLSERQVEYSIEKINAWLSYHKMETIYHDGRQFIIDTDVFEILAIDSEVDLDFYVLSKEERMDYLLILILLRRETVSLDLLSQKLSVSKNTVMSDIRELNKKLRLQLYEVSIHNSRSKGYYVEGSEFNKRRVLLESIHSLSQSNVGLQLVKNTVVKDEFRLFRIEKMLDLIEHETNQNFADYRLKTLAYELEAFIQRIEMNKNIQEDYFIHFYDLADTEEYRYIDDFLSKESIKEENEKIYITLYLLSVNRSYQEVKANRKEVLSLLETAVFDFLDEFERIAVVKLQNKEDLASKLFQHLKPAYYRIKFNLTTEYSSLQQVEEELQSTYYFVRTSLKPLKEALGLDIPYYEELFITLFIASHLTKNQRENLEHRRKKAVIVCPNGITISSIVKNNLKSLFPEIEFHETLSIREYQDYNENFDLTFSTVPLKPRFDKPVYVVDKVMTDLEKIKLRERVMGEVYLLPYQNFRISDFINVVEEYGEVHDYEKLEEALVNMLYPKIESKPQRNMISEENQSLLDLVPESRIKIIESIDSWKIILQEASKPLLDDGIITEEYVVKMQELYPDLSENIILQRNIAIPHAGIDDGVNDLGMSLLILKEPYIYKDLPLHLVVVIATPDKQQHLEALMQLFQLSKDQEVIELLINAANKKEVYTLIKQFISRDGDKV